MEQLSVLDIFKIGIGPSSSHTLGPWRAALAFLVQLKVAKQLDAVSAINVLLYGSLAKTGEGHGTDIAITLGLKGYDPIKIDLTTLNEEISVIKNNQTIKLAGEQQIPFSPSKDIYFLKHEPLPYHPNAMTIQAFFRNGKACATTFYSVGGGFIVTENEEIIEDNLELKFPFQTAKELLNICDAKQLKISSIVEKNETAWRESYKTKAELDAIVEVMNQCIYKGCHTGGILPGGLQVTRRAKNYAQNLLTDAEYSDFDSWLLKIKKDEPTFDSVTDWVSCFALAVNEENANFGRVVTAPTNGSAGVIPAVLLYHRLFNKNFKESDLYHFLYTAAAIGFIFKKGATLSAAMGGCQAEIGVSSAMAAAALTEVSGGSPAQALMAAEIAMEHHLGLTCDPVGGLVQIPCIERNAMGAIKAILATKLALKSDVTQAKVSLDAVVKTLWDTAQDMSLKYKETSDGGLAINVPLTVVEC